MKEEKVGMRRREEEVWGHWLRSRVVTDPRGVHIVCVGVFSLNVVDT